MKLVQVLFDAATEEEIMEELRRDLVVTMKSGDTYVLFLDKMCPDFKGKYCGKMFPTDKIFNFNEWRKQSQYRSILTKEEDKDICGNQGMMRMDDDFNIVILSNAEDQESQKSVMDSIPNIDNFNVLKVIKPNE
eukprot:CAMPEP_0170556550 /NCGR_PEP_ID=MMETSP0211-20121228/17405_1 /TAXON_ID=311385 /ORGANISM="Pseudokeronopsis sp., Strain OXSARD2" /LENGTH=133 /DNA_ID=CAMNT_0010866961 /DNA_START=121 /DNA_END=520 /DNA_ORIENTATION=-